MRKAMAQFDTQALEQKVKQKKTENGNSTDTAPISKSALGGLLQVMLMSL